MSVIGSRKSAKGIIVGLLSLLTKPKFCFSVLKITVTIQYNIPQWSYAIWVMRGQFLRADRVRITDKYG